jgi:hypothetical protein
MTETELARYFEDVHTFYRALPVNRYPALATVAEDMTSHDGEERFEFGLTVLIEGLRAADRTGS